MGEDERTDSRSTGGLPPPVTYVPPLSMGGTTVIYRQTEDPDATKVTPPSRSDGASLGQLGEHDLLEEVARGGMGVVYKAWQRRANRLVALKTILAGRLASPEEVARFEAEAKAAARLDHPGIVPIYEVGEVEGTHFFSMAFVDGASLDALANAGPLRSRDAARILKSVADAVHYAHLRGVVHRDLKPSNILLDSENQPRVTDFGLAKRLEQDGGLTVSGQVMGTPGFMPPEQARGEAHLVGPESDVYSLGAVLYFLLTGQPPFAAASVWETLTQVIEREPAPLRSVRPGIDADLETICLRCLQKSLASRYRSAGELADELERYLHGEPIWARPVGPVERLVRWCRRNPKLAAATGAAVFSASAAIIILAVAYGEARKLVDINDRQLEFLSLENAGLADANAELDEKARSAEQRADEAEKKAATAETEADALRRRVEELETTLRTSDANDAGRVGDR